MLLVCRWRCHEWWSRSDDVDDGVSKDGLKQLESSSEMMVHGTTWLGRKTSHIMDVARSFTKALPKLLKLVHHIRYGSNQVKETWHDYHLARILYIYWIASTAVSQFLLLLLLFELINQTGLFGPSWVIPLLFLLFISEDRITSAQQKLLPLYVLSCCYSVLFYNHQQPVFDFVAVEQNLPSIN